MDEFALKWVDEYYYTFPPVCLINKCMHKIVLDRAEGVLLWATQAFRKILVETPRLLPPVEEILVLPSQPEAINPVENLRLLVCWVSRNSCLNKTFLKRQQTLSWRVGDLTLRNNTTVTIKRWLEFCRKRKANHIQASVALGLDLLTVV